MESWFILARNSSIISRKRCIDHRRFVRQTTKLRAIWTITDAAPKCPRAESPASSWPCAELTRRRVGGAKSTAPSCPILPMEWGTLGVHTCSLSIFSTVFARGRDQCSFWLSVHCGSLLLIGWIACTECKDVAFATDVAWSMCLCVCLLDTTVSPTERLNRSIHLGNGLMCVQGTMY